MPGFALAWAASAVIRAASLNLCTDEYLLLLAERNQIASISYLAAEPQESVLWSRARGIHRNRGTLESALAARPNLILTMGGGGKATGALAGRLGLMVLDLPYPQSIEDVRAQAVRVADAVGAGNRAHVLLSRLDLLEGTRPRQPADAAFLSGAGNSIVPGSLGAQWMALAGYRQRALPNGRLSLEQLATDAPKWLIRSDYRAGQWSRAQAWLDHPLVRRLQARTVPTDGRSWTCGGLPMVAEVERLRRGRH
jgi:iron complex transport system substrate-binding protein